MQLLITCRWTPYTGFAFVDKPPLILHASDWNGVEIGRGTGTSSTFDLTVEMKGINDDPKAKVVEHEFKMISREELQGVSAYVASRRKKFHATTTAKTEGVENNNNTNADDVKKESPHDEDSSDDSDDDDSDFDVNESSSGEEGEEEGESDDSDDDDGDGDGSEDEGQKPASSKKRSREDEE